MHMFTGIDYLKIDIANHYGLDKLTWDARIAWADSQACLMDAADSASSPVRYRKAVRALEDAYNKVPTGHLMGLDATASGIQIMACLIGCKTTAAAVNLVNTGKREDVYQSIANAMTKIGIMGLTKEVVKRPIMTYMYGSRAQPESVFGRGTEELDAFYSALHTTLPGAVEVMNTIQACWQDDALEHAWTLPDGHRAIVKVVAPVDKKITVDELGSSFTHRIYENTTVSNGLGLAANIVQSIDAWIVREMVRSSAELGYDLLTIHDDFLALPHYMNDVRICYTAILATLADMPLLEDILNEITGTKEKFVKKSNNLSEEIIKSEYALS